MAFERTLFRATRGNMFLKQAAVENLVTDPVSGDKVQRFICWLYQVLHIIYFLLFYSQIAKNVFVAFYSGERAKEKIIKICDSFGANRYPHADDLERRREIIEEVCKSSLNS